MNLAVVHPHTMRSLSAVVVDEVQTISDPSRGPALEFLLTLLRSGHARVEPAQIIGLSAVIGDSGGLEAWLGGALLRSETRPVPLLESVLIPPGSLRSLAPDGTESIAHRVITPEAVSGSQSSKPWIIPLLRRLAVEQHKKAIVFRSFRGETVGTARYLAEALDLESASDVVEKLPAGDLSASSEDLRVVLQRGIGFHNSDLDFRERAVLEEQFREPESRLRVLVATTTLAMGINTPAQCVVVAGLTHPGGVPFSVAEYKNMVGRAGRPGHSEQGESFLVATGDPSPDVGWAHYVRGRPENVESHFLADSTDPQTLVLRCLAAMGGSVSSQALVSMLENSFAIWQQRQHGYTGGWNREDLDRDIEALVSGELVDREPNGNLTLTELGRYAGESGLEVRSVTQVASLLRFAPPKLNIPTLLTVAQVTCELDGVTFPCNRKSHKEQRRWPAYLQENGVGGGVARSLHVGGELPVLRAKRAAACLMYVSALSLADAERELLQHMREASAAGPIRQVAARTRDVVNVVVQIADFYGKKPDDSVDVDQLLVRLELGIPSTMVTLATQVGGTLTRGQYLELHRSGMTSWDKIVSAPRQILDEILGDSAIGDKLRSAATDFLR